MVGYHTSNGMDTHIKNPRSTVISLNTDTHTDYQCRNNQSTSVTDSRMMSTRHEYEHSDKRNERTHNTDT